MHRLKSPSMIVSNSYKFIFAKTRKVAGSSIELKLSENLAPEDFLTNLNERDQKTAFARTWRKMHDVRVPARGIVPVRLSEHAPVSRAFRTFGRPVSDHIVVTIERNPWDRAVSAFFWNMRRHDYRARSPEEQRIAFRRYLYNYAAPSFRTGLSGHYKHRVLSHKYIYMIDGVAMTDFLIRYECLAEDLLAFGEKIGLPTPLALEGVSAKAQLRPKKTKAYQAMYDDETRAYVGELSKWEIDAYGYDFEGKNKPTFIADPRRYEVKDAFFRRHGQ